MRAVILTLSDSSYAGTRQDRSGPIIMEFLQKEGYEIIHAAVLPDGKEPLIEELCRWSDLNATDLFLTTGGTGKTPITAKRTPSTRDYGSNPVEIAAIYVICDA